VGDHGRRQPKTFRVVGEAGLDSSGIRETLVKHLLAVAVAVVALGLLASCGGDDFGLTAETRSKLDADWEKTSSIEQEAVCEKLKSPQGKLEAFQSIKEGDLPENEKTAESMLEYIQAKC
jgi:hypothetical protein